MSGMKTSLSPDECFARNPLPKVQFNRRKDHRQNQNNLQSKNHRHAIKEIPVPCLMVKKMHTRDGADAAADDGQHEERGFRDTKGPFDGPSFVHTHYDKADYIDSSHIQDNKIKRVHGL